MVRMRAGTIPGERIIVSRLVLLEINQLTDDSHGIWQREHAVADNFCYHQQTDELRARVEC